MIYIGLFILSSAAIIVLMAAGLHHAELEAIKSMKVRPSGSSIFPVIPVIPAIFVIGAWLINTFTNNLGYWLGLFICGLVLVIAYIVILFLSRKINDLDKP